MSSAFQVGRPRKSSSFMSSRIWHPALPIKISFFMMRVLVSRVPVMEVLQRFGVYGPSMCSCCSNPGVETMDHVFCTGELARGL